MKKQILIIALTSIALAGHTQTKKDTIKADKPTYNYSTTLPLPDYQIIVKLIKDYRDLIAYSPYLDAESKVKIEQRIDQYTRELPGRVKVDSTIVNKTGSIKKP